MTIEQHSYKIHLMYGGGGGAFFLFKEPFSEDEITVS